MSDEISLILAIFFLIPSFILAGFFSYFIIRIVVGSLNSRKRTEVLKKLRNYQEKWKKDGVLFLNEHLQPERREMTKYEYVKNTVMTYIRLITD